MKTGTIILLLLLAAGVGSHAQTARIEHRSHSGARPAFGIQADNFGKYVRHDLPEAAKKKPRAADTIKVIKVKPWRQVKDSLPAAAPPVNPVYTKKQKQAAKTAIAKAR